MKKSYKFLCLILSVFILFSICGCTSDKAEDANGKKIIKLATMGLDENIQRRVDLFNAENKDFQIQVDDYSKYDNGDDDNSGETKLTTQLLSGDMPDIIDLSQLPYENYIAKGLMEDLYPYMEQDSEINLENMTESILEAYEVNGKLYQTVPDYVIVTVVGKSDDIGEDPGWNIDEISAYVDSLNNDEQSFVYTTKENILYYCSMMALNQFVSVANGKCDFENEEFVKLLEFANKYQDEISLGDDFTPEIELIKSGKVKLNLMSFFDLKNYEYYKSMFNGELTFKGFPTSSKLNGSSVDANINLGMSAKSKYKEEVWSFLRTFYMDEYQKNTDYLPINKTFLYDKFEDAKHFNDNNISYGWDEFVVNLPNASETDIAKIEDLINSIDHPMQKDSKIIEIILDEADAYFTNQRSAEETAKVIQSRVKIYIDENT